MPLIGVSIAIPEPCGPELQDYRVSLGEDGARQIPTHLTLVPPTEIAADDVTKVISHLEYAAAEHQRFGIHLRGTGTFRPVSPVVFVGVVQGISECELLAKSMRTGPLDLSMDFPYHPHVTIAHHLPEEILDRAFDEFADFDCEFDVSKFWLYRYDEQPGWVPTRAFALR
ncbi:MAG: 2'-5' RNA ligase family protein [Actinomycetota bacterium]|nr:2'-5' RNA ligase family protein [Actinomycetota bacterium]